MSNTTPNVPVKGVTIHGKDLKKLFEYYFDLYTNYDRHDAKYRGVSRLERPENPYTRDTMTIETCLYTCLGLREEYLKYFEQRRAVDPYWVERDNKAKEPIQ